MSRSLAYELAWYLEAGEPLHIVATRRAGAHTQRLVLKSLVMHVGADGIAYPGRERIAKANELATQTVTDCLRALEDQGHLVATKDHKRGVQQRWRVLPQIVAQLDQQADLVGQVVGQVVGEVVGEVVGVPRHEVQEEVQDQPPKSPRTTKAKTKQGAGAVEKTETEQPAFIEACIAEDLRRQPTTPGKTLTSQMTAFYAKASTDLANQYPQAPECSAVQWAVNARQGKKQSLDLMRQLDPLAKDCPTCNGSGMHWGEARLDEEGNLVAQPPQPCPTCKDRHKATRNQHIAQG